MNRVSIVVVPIPHVAHSNVVPNVVACIYDDVVMMLWICKENYEWANLFVHKMFGSGRGIEAIL